MKIVIQRVKQASVEAGSGLVGSIDSGFLLLVGVEKGDSENEALMLAEKISKMRIFEDENGKMNLNLEQVGGSILSVSQFTLCADCRRGNRPDFLNSAPPDEANVLYEYFNRQLENKGIRVEKGIFGADMKVSLINDGPVTIILDSDDFKKSRK